jgi:hypothetical protein
MLTDDASYEGKYEYRNAVLLEPPETVEYKDPDSMCMKAILFPVSDLLLHDSQNILVGYSIGYIVNERSITATNMTADSATQNGNHLRMVWELMISAT